MIEILCIAAEITVVLLILSIAMPLSATKHAQSKSDSDGPPVESQLLHDCEESLLALRSLIYLHTSQSIASTSPEQSNSESYAAVLHRLRDHLNTIELLQVSSAVDSVTKLPNREQLEKLLNASEEWSPLVDVSTWVGLVQVDNLDELDDEHGPMASELILREVASYLRESVSGRGPLARFNHRSFAIALHGPSKDHAIEFFESVRGNIQRLTATLGDSTITATASASAAKFDEAAPLTELWERLEDGMVEAISAGSNCGRWFDTSDSLWRPMGSEHFDKSQSPALEDGSNTNEADESAPAGIDQSSSTPIDKPSKFTPTSETLGAVPSDSKPDASGADDIASLFKAAHENQNNLNAGESKPVEPTSPATPIPVSSDATPEVKDESSAVTMEDDIAALFAAARAQKSPSIPTTAESDPPKPSKKPEIEENTEGLSPATNDDIASLFATFKKT